jgi:CRISPR-associated endonuclease/helicase Cas3
MRSLVEQTANAARTWFENLGLDVPVFVLMGGAVDEHWDALPEREAVLVGTLDQLLSRALNRGYGVSRYRWPVHFAWLNNDALWVVDEVQLMGVGLSTTCQLDAFRRRFGAAGPTHTLWCSATLDERLLRTVDNRERRFTSLSSGPEDLAQPALGRRLEALKVLDPEPLRFDRDPRRQAEILLEPLAQLHREGTRTLVILNRVARAIELHRALAARGLRSHLLHSRFRPLDRRRVEHDALQDSSAGIVVATQAVEAGVDMSSRALITDLAPWSSLVQRFGRCNRYGEFGDAADPAQVRWIDVPSEEAAPYEAADLDRARALLGQHKDGVGPMALRSEERDSVRPAGPVVRAKDLLALFDTSPDLSGLDLDVSVYVRERDADVQFAWRELNDGPDPEDPLPHRDELCRIGLPAARALLGSGRAWSWDGLENRWGSVGAQQLIPGRVYLVDVAVGGYSPTLGLTLDARDRPPAVESTSVAADADERELLSIELGQFVTLAQHSLDVEREAADCAAALGLDVPLARAVGLAARWHDLGKAHPLWQQMIRSGVVSANDPGPGPWAKSEGRPTQRIERPAFRHELGSALAVLAHLGPDADRELVAYLVAAHHGKLRTRLAARPTERQPQNGSRLALGHRDGDIVPEVDLGDGLSIGPTTIDLEPMELGAASGSWTALVLDLLERLGPIRLAYLESLVRVADWRASAAVATRADSLEFVDA